MSKSAARWICALLLALATAPGHAEQRQSFGGWDVHYVVLPTGFLKPDIAAQYGITRGGQLLPLTFREVTEGEAVYYLAAVKHTHEEVLRFEILLSAPEAPLMQLKFQQKLYWEEP
jgi:hypothetical protein